MSRKKQSFPPCCSRGQMFLSPSSRTMRCRNQNHTDANLAQPNGDDRSLLEAVLERVLRQGPV